MKKRLTELQGYIDDNKTDNFYAWADWLKIRKAVLKLDNYECQMCKKKGRHRKAAVVHHVKHLKERPDMALTIWDGEERQLISLCRECHELVHPERTQGYKWRSKNNEITHERWD